MENEVAVDKNQAVNRPGLPLVGAEGGGTRDGGGGVTGPRAVHQLDLLPLLPSTVELVNLCTAEMWRAGAG